MKKRLIGSRRSCPSLCLLFIILIIPAVSPNESFSIESPSLTMDYTYISHNPIWIDGFNDFNSTAAAEGWPGNGTVNNPFIISGYNITNSTHAIYIRNVGCHFIIQDCFIDCMKTTKLGIYLDYVSNGTIRNNIVYNCEEGIYIQNSKDNICENNEVNNSYISGIGVTQSDNIIIRKNHISHCRGIMGAPGIDDSGDHNQYLDNVIEDYKWGFRAITSHYAIIRGNTIKNMKLEGILLDAGYAIGAVVEFNTITNCASYGIYLSSTYDSDNIIRYNVLRNNSYSLSPTESQIKDIGINNSIYSNCYSYTYPDPDTYNGPFSYQYGRGETKDLSALVWPIHLPIQISRNSEFLDKYHLPGYGTKKSPYLIQGYTFAGYDSLISISSTDAYFIIRNCYFIGINNKSTSILLNNVKNCIVEKVIIEHTNIGVQLDSNSKYNQISNSSIKNSNIGIYLKDASNNIFFSNILENNTIGYFETQNTLYNTFRDNIISNSDYAIKKGGNLSTIEYNEIYDNINGISLDASCFNQIIGNQMHNCTSRAISLSSASTNNSITNNHIEGSQSGLLITSRSNGNTIRSNKILNNVWGLNMRNSSYNSILQNEISGSNYNLYINANDWSDQGSTYYNSFSQNIFSHGTQPISLYGDSRWNRFTFNDFISNSDGTQITDNGLNNSYEDNWWSDHLIPDSDADGFVDTPYIIKAEVEDQKPHTYIINLPYDYHSELKILNNSDFSIQAINEGWTGEGTASNPYIIQGYYFMKINTTNEIRQTDKHFIIRDCIFIGLDLAFYLENVKNGIFESNIIYQCNLQAFKFINCSSIVIDDNFVYSCKKSAIFLRECSNVKIFSNKINWNKGGFSFDKCQDISSVSNEIKYCNQFNMILNQSKHCNISKNTFFDSNNSLLIKNSEYNLITDNSFKNNNFGIHLTGSNYNDLTSNFIDSQKESAIFISNSENNKIQNNDLSKANIGISLSNSNKTSIACNFIYENRGGINITENSMNNYIYANQIYNNCFHGIILSSNSGTNIIGNLFQKNIGYAIFCFSQNINMKYNTFIDNCQIYKNQTYFTALITLGSNFWSDHTNIDLNNDNIADNPYSNIGPASLSDNIPSIVPLPLINIRENNDFILYGFIGSGTFNDPYLIDNYNLRYNLADNINIVNTTKEFIIRNCVINGLNKGFTGINLRNMLLQCSKVVDNTIVNTNLAMNLENITRLEICNNQIFDNNHGVYSSSVFSQNIIKENIIYMTSYSGIYLSFAVNNSIINNTLFQNDIGLFIENSKENNLTSNLIYKNKQSGILLQFTKGNLSLNLISENIIRDNDFRGIQIISACNNTINNNTFFNNKNYGLFFNEFSQNNLIEFNDFISSDFSGKHAFDDGRNSTNYFSYNYWNTWTDPDENEDLIVDNPFLIPGSASSVDIYPLTIPYHLKQPLFLNPMGNEVFNGTITIRWTSSIDKCGHEVTYSLYYSTGTSWILIISSLSEISYSWDTVAIQNSDNCRLKLVAKCEAGIFTSTVSNLFTIFNHQLTPIIIYNPNVQGQTLFGEVLLDWCDVIDSFNHTIKYSLFYKGGIKGNWTTIVTNINNSEFLWNTTDLQDDINYQLLIIAICSDDLQVSTLSLRFSIHNQLSVPYIISPQAGNVLNGSVTIYWEKSTDPLEMEVKYEIFYSFDFGFSWNLLVSNLPQEQNNYYWDTTMFEDGSDYLLKVVAYTPDGLRKEAMITGTFTIQNDYWITYTTYTSDTTLNSLIVIGFLGLITVAIGGAVAGRNTILSKIRKEE